MTLATRITLAHTAIELHFKTINNYNFWRRERNNNREEKCIVCDRVQGCNGLIKYHEIDSDEDVCYCTHFDLRREINLGQTDSNLAPISYSNPKVDLIIPDKSWCDCLCGFCVERNEFITTLDEMGFYSVSI